jgi:antitoxin HicB
MKSTVTVILEPEEDGGYSIHCPALPGCSSQVDTIEDALTNIQEAILGVLKSRQQEGLLPPIETLETVTEGIRQILAGRAEDWLSLTIETRIVELPVEVVN